jgi:hypothetical protein
VLAGDLTGADLRGAGGEPGSFASAVARNMISPDGAITGLFLATGDRLLVRDDDGVADKPLQDWVAPREPLAISIQNRFAMSDGGILQMIFESDAWDSLISFQPDIPVELGGTLQLTFADDVNAAAQIGRTMHIFDWRGVTPNGHFPSVSPYAWDANNLYTTGEITLLGVPEPDGVVLALVAFARAIRQKVRRARASKA